MFIEIVQRGTFFEHLRQIDEDLAEQTRRRGCPWCGGALHRAAYLRKPRGGPDLLLRCSPRGQPDVPRLRLS